MSRPLSVSWSTHSKRWPAFALVLIYWATRLHRLTAFPAFDDETYHIRWAKMVWALNPFQGADTGRVLNVLWYAAFYPFGPATLWVSRASYFFMGGLGFVALLTAGRWMFGRRAARIAGAAFILLPFAFFFERMALADPPGMACLSLLIMACWRAMRQADPWTMALGGLALAGMLLAKLTTVSESLVPLLAFLLLGRGQRRAGARMLGLYAVAVLCLAPFVGFLFFRAHSTLGFGSIRDFSTPDPLDRRLLHNFAALAGFIPSYVTWPTLILAVVGIALAAARRQRAAWLLAATVALPIASIAPVSNILASRHFVVILPGLVLLAGYGADRLIALWPPRFAPVAQALLPALVLISGAGQFLYAAYWQPDALPLVGSDVNTYISDWTAGFGVERVVPLVAAKRAGGPLAVVVTEGWHVPGLSLYEGRDQELRYNFPVVAPDLVIAWLTDGCEPFTGPVTGKWTTLFVIERNRHAGTAACLHAEKKLIASFAKPGGMNVIDVYEIMPLP